MAAAADVAANGGTAEDLTVMDLSRLTAAAEEQATGSIRGGFFDPTRIPPLLPADESDLALPVLTYVLHRQSRVNAVQPTPELLAVQQAAPPPYSDRLAAAILAAWVQVGAPAKHKWPLAVAGVLGGEEAFEGIRRLLRTWSQGRRRRMAQYAVEALGLMGSDRALRELWATRLRLKATSPAVADAAGLAFSEHAAARGLEPDALAEQLTPTVGFAPDRRRRLPDGVEVRLGLDFQLTGFDLKTGSPLPQIPRKHAACVKRWRHEVKGASQVWEERLELALIDQRRWPTRRWQELFRQHPVLVPFAVRLVWEWSDGDDRLAFRALEDGSLTGLQDDEVVLPETGTVGLLQPGRLSLDQRTAWLQHLDDYRVTPPFAQLSRRLPEGE